MLFVNTVHSLAPRKKFTKIICKKNPGTNSFFSPCHKIQKVRNLAVVVALQKCYKEIDHEMSLNDKVPKQFYKNIFIPRCEDEVAEEPAPLIKAIR